MQNQYVVAEPKTGKPLIAKPFDTYDSAVRASHGVAGSIVTNIQFVERKGFVGMLR